MIGVYSYGQKGNKNFKIKSVQVVSDSIKIDTISISPFNFKVFDEYKEQIDTANYEVNFEKALLIIDKSKYNKINIEYNALPEFLTKVYSKFDKKLIVPKGLKIND